MKTYRLLVGTLFMVGACTGVSRATPWHMADTAATATYVPASTQGSSPTGSKASLQRECVQVETKSQQPVAAVGYAVLDEIADLVTPLGIVQILDLSTGSSTRVGSERLVAAFPSVSPDRTHLAYSEFNKSDSAIRDGSVVIASADGEVLSRIER